MTPLAPDPAGVLHRPADRPEERQPADDRRLPRHDAAAARVRHASTTGKPPSRLDIDDLDAPLIGAFLDHLEHDRGNSPRTRNARLAAIHSLYRYAALRHPEHAAHDRARDRDPQQTPRPRDRLLPRTARDQSAARGARPNNLARAPRPRTAAARHPDRRCASQNSPASASATSALDTGASVRVIGKGRKHRVTPLTPDTATVLGAWLKERRGENTDPLFPTRQGRPLTPKAIAWLLDKHTSTAAIKCPSLTTKRVTPHVLRHYVDGMVMWPAGVFPLLGLSRAPVPAT